ncbi:unnamed protein product [Meloidogyne enterolobii]|uniref:Uncharacterized protein n=1 Tax=Meloidogyne enterolobii TaxID=390850 RepID=A0ACB0YXJ2_MELEN
MYNYANELYEKKFCDLTIKLNNEIFKYADFVKIKNKWKEIDAVYSYCCENKCINTTNPTGSCIKGNGFINLINDENIKYILGKGGSNSVVKVYAENSFKKPQNCFKHCLYYFEVKCIFEGELNKGVNFMRIGLKNCSTNKYIYYTATESIIYNEKLISFKLSTIFNNNDIVGCGLVYPPTNKLIEEFPYVFFTQNGKQIGKSILLKENFDSYIICVLLRCCFVEANFGNDLKTKPFKYDISKHLVLKEFH